MAAPRILLADDQPDVRESLRLLLKAEGFRVEAVATPQAVLGAVEAALPDVVLLDMNFQQDTTSGREGLELLERLKALEPELPLVVMTAWGSVELAVEAMKRGARDFVLKPWENARLLATLRSQAELGEALRRSRRLEAENRALRADELPPLVAESRPMRTLVELLARVGPSEASVLITGENGTGKGLLARHLHARSPRAEAPLLTLNAGGLGEGGIQAIGAVGVPNLLRHHQAQTLQVGFGLLHRQLEASPIDGQQQLAPFDELVILHPHLTDQAGEIRGQPGHFTSHAAIPGPGCLHVVVPQMQASGDGHQQHDQGGDDSGQVGKQFHHLDFSIGKLVGNKELDQPPTGGGI